jgi:DNA-directed RNA polymerase specialized sigma24 family protein
MTDPLAPLRELGAIPDPVERAKAIGAALKALPDVNAELRAARQAVVLELRTKQHMSYGRIAELLGLSRGRVQQIAEGRSTGRRREVEGTPE